MPPTAATLAPSSPAPTLAQSLWRRFCQLMTAIFYRGPEVSGLENLPPEGPVVLAANHVNALADAVVVQACCPRPVHPLARSGLFRSPLLRPVLELIQAVPIYRRRPGQDQATAANVDSFERCYEYLEEGRVLLIFPEGQSHSDPMLRPLKTGAARLAIGLRERQGILPAVVPVGLIFPKKGRFRSPMLVHYGKPVHLDAADGGESTEEAVRRFTAAIVKGLESVTLNLETWEDFELMRLLQSFFVFRDGRHEVRQREGDSVRRQSLAERFQSFRRLDEVHRWLRHHRPGEVSALREKLKRFERLCKRHGVEDYHLDLRYRPALVARFAARSLAFALLVFPLALWGLVNSAAPYFLTRSLTRLAARGRDQYDTGGMLFGLLFFLLFWGGQSFAVYWLWGVRAAAFYALSLPATAGIALLVGRERRRIMDNVRVFFLFLRKREVQGYLRQRREELEVEVARLARIAREAAS